MKIAVVDDHDLIREGLNAVLNNHGVTQVSKYGTAMGLIESMDGGDRYDFFIIDLELPDEDGFALMEMIRARDAHAKVIVSTVHDEIWTLRKLLARNVDGIIYKTGDGDDIVEAINAILKGEKYLSEGALRSLKYATDDSHHPSVRELEVLQQIAKGKTSREIATSMFVSENTVEAHRKSLFSKIGAVNVADLIVKSIEKGYLKSGVKP
ncbi:MAG: response regulator transcription factor [Bacteroides sp.]|nr:response regulator transcription factor [Bacteroides sp.]